MRREIAWVLFYSTIGQYSGNQPFPFFYLIYWTLRLFVTLVINDEKLTASGVKDIRFILGGRWALFPREAF